MGTRRLLHLTLALALGALPLLAVPAAADVQGVTPTTIRVGLQIPITGPISSSGIPFRMGAELAAEEINAHGGINGRKLELVVEDDAGTAEGGISAVRRLMDQDKVFAILGGSGSAGTAVVIPLVQQAKMLYYDSQASDPRILENYSPYVFSGAVVVRSDVVNTVLKTVRGPFKGQNLAILMSDQPVCTSALALFQERAAGAGVKLAAVQKYRDGDTDFTAQSLALQSANADAIFLCGLPVDAGRVLAQLKRNGVTTKILRDTSLSESIVNEMAGPAAEGTYTLFTASTQSLDDQTGAMGEFRGRFFRKYPNAPASYINASSADAYQDLYVLAEGIRRAGKDLTPERVIAGLAQVRDFVAGKGGAWRFAVAIGTPRSFKDGDHKGSREAQLLVIRNGKYQHVTDFSM
jgi:branched-chain amino acid transport system substrate-binding protein